MAQLKFDNENVTKVAQSKEQIYSMMINEPDYSTTGFLTLTVMNYDNRPMYEALINITLVQEIS